MKNFKSALSLLTAIIMVFAMMPGVMANEIAPITAEDIARYGTGNSSGRLIEAGMTVSYGDGTTMTAAPYLVDGFHYSLGEISSLQNDICSYNDTAAGVTHTVNNTLYTMEDGTVLDNSNLNLSTSTGEDTLVLLSSVDKNALVFEGTKATTKWVWTTTTDTTGTVTLTETNNVIEIKWPTEKRVKRLEMWVHPVGAINEYEIQYYDGEKWVGEHSTGNLDQTQTAAENTVESKSATAYIMLFDEVETTGIRFIAKTFKQGVTEAKIAEIVPRSSNDANLLGFGILTRGSNTNGWLNGIGNGQSVNSSAGANNATSPYAYGFANSMAYGITTWNYQSNGAYPTFWPAYSYNPHTLVHVTYSNHTTPVFWYATGLNNSPQKISKIVFNLSSDNGAVKEFQIWYNNTDIENGYKVSNSRKTTPDAENSNWELATTVSGNFEAGSSTEVYIPNGEAAEFWMIKVTKWEGTPAMTCPEFYVIPDSEIPQNNASFAAKHIFDDIAVADNNASINISDTFNYNGTVHSVKWESNSKYLDLETGDIAPHDADEEITLTAKVSAGDFSYVVEKTLTLPAFENELKITAFNGDGSTTDIFAEGSGESILTDKYYYVAYDTKLLGDSATIANNLNRFAKLTGKNSEIKWSWSVKTTTKRLDMWLVGVGGIKDYEIQKSNNGTTWEEVQSGQFAEGSDSYAYYYPVVFNEPVTTKNLRIVVKSFYGESETAYVSETIIRDNNDINFGQDSLIGKKADDVQYWTYSPYLLGFNASATGSVNKKSYVNGSMYIYPSWSTSGGSPGSFFADDDGIWYATSFGSSNVKVNKIGVKVTSGTVTKLKVYIGKGNVVLHGNSVPEIPLTYRASKNSYKNEPDAVIECNLTKENTNVLFEIPQAYAGNGILIMAEGTEDASISRYQFYSVGDYELTSVVAPTDEKIEGTVAAGEKLTFSVFSCNYNAPDAKVFFALYEDGALSGVTAAPCALTGVKTQTAEYTIPATDSENIKVVAYLWDGKTLNPLIDTPVTAESAPAETE